MDSVHHLIAVSHQSTQRSQKIIVHMQTIKRTRTLPSPQFMDDKPPFNSLASICKWAAGLGYIGVQIPSWDSRLIDLQKAAESKTIPTKIKGIVQSAGLQITETIHAPAGTARCRTPLPTIPSSTALPQPPVHGNPKARQEWAVQQLRYAAKASQNLGLNAHAHLQRCIAWPPSIPGLNGPAGLVETGFKELAGTMDAHPQHIRRSRGSISVMRSTRCEDLHDGVTYEISS